MGKKILLADDSITIQKVIELTFSDEDFEVSTVGNGRMAMEKALDIRPDVILCDIIMPEKDGYEVCEFVKKNPLLAHVPVLLLTGAFEPFDQERATRAGCDGFLAKPFEPQMLVAKVKQLLQQSASRVPVAPGRPATSPATPAVTAPTSPAPRVDPAPQPASSALGLKTEAVRVPSWATPPPTPAPSMAPSQPSVAKTAPVVPDVPEFIPEDFSEAKPETSLSEPMEEPAALDDDLYMEPEPEPELASMSAEETATLHAPPALEQIGTVQFTAPPTGWSQPTVEVSLEARAQAGMASAVVAPQETYFEEVFEEETIGTAPETPSWPEPEPEPSVVETAPPPVMPLANSFSEVAPEGPEPVTAPNESRSTAADVAVPSEMVETIAQRVVSQISEKIIREVAWEVIPDLAETLIKKEIERLKAELQQG